MADRREQRRRADALLDLIGLSSFAGVYPHQLSGGMRQRVELARALGGETPLLLMDEPFSSLDYLTRLRMRRELARILREQPRTVVLVTHDIEEAAQLADRVLVLSERPARVRDEVVLEIPRPRDPTHPGSCARSTGSSPRSGWSATSNPADPPRRCVSGTGGTGMKRCSPFVRWGAGALVFVAVLAVLRLQPWQRSAGRRRPSESAGRARDPRRGVPAGDLTPDVPGHRLRVEDQPRHPVRVAALHRLSHGGRDREERPARRDVHDRAAGDEAARAGGAGQDRVPRPPRRLDGHGPQGPARRGR